jgi:hypothetical protein
VHTTPKLQLGISFPVVLVLHLHPTSYLMTGKKRKILPTQYHCPQQTQVLTPYQIIGRPTTVYGVHVHHLTTEKKLDKWHVCVDFVHAWIIRVILRLKNLATVVFLYRAEDVVDVSFVAVAPPRANKSTARHGAVVILRRVAVIHPPSVGKEHAVVLKQLLVHVFVMDVVVPFCPVAKEHKKMMQLQQQSLLEIRSNIVGEVLYYTQHFTI